MITKEKINPEDFDKFLDQPIFFNCDELVLTGLCGSFYPYGFEALIEKYDKSYHGEE